MRTRLTYLKEDNNLANNQTPKHKTNTLAAIGRFIIIAILISIITGCIVASALTVYVLNSLDSSDAIVLENIKLSYTTILYANDPATGEPVELQRVQNNENRIWVDYDQIPEYLPKAAIAIEDKRFITHIGVDFKRTMGAAVNMIIPIYEGMPGGSTITQQLVKNITKDDEVHIDRKIREIFRAINLERNYSKDQIMESYLNTIALGNGTNGVEAAANLYFGKKASELSLAESASLISITQNPSKYSPFRSVENNRKRQLLVLKFMLQQGLITQEQHDAAVAEEMEFKKEEYTETAAKVQSWYVDMVYEDVIRDLVARNGYTKAGAEDALLRGGFRIYTTVDSQLQDYLQEAYTNPATFPPIKNKDYPESAFVIIDHATGEIKALVGSKNKKEGARLFNRATSALRHPGSTIKPIASYAPALEQDLIYWSMIMEDSPILLNENDPSSVYPKNFYNNYLGGITVTEAIQRSTNTIPVKLVQTMSPRTSFNFLRDKLGFVNLVEKDVRNGRVYSDIDISPMALGSMTDGVTPLEMAAAYQIFGNGGLYIPPHSYTKVLDSDGNVILENKYVPTRVVSPETATIMNRLLQRVTAGPPGTGVAAALNNFPVAGKTGTSDGDENQWFIGVTPYYVGVCWLGYAEPATINYAGFRYPPPVIWKNVMQPIHSKLKYKEFPDVGNVVSYVYCTQSGQKATPNCEHTATGWYKMSRPLDDCSIHGQQQPENPWSNWNDFWGWSENDD